MDHALSFFRAYKASVGAGDSRLIVSPSDLVEFEYRVETRMRIKSQLFARDFWFDPHSYLDEVEACFAGHEAGKRVREAFRLLQKEERSHAE